MQPSTRTLRVLRPWYICGSQIELRQSLGHAPPGGMSLDDAPPGFNLGRDDAWIPRLAEVLARRAPSLADVGIASGC